MRRKYIEEKIGEWFIEDTLDDNIVSIVRSGGETVFTNVPKKLAQKLVSAQDFFITMIHSMYQEHESVKRFRNYIEHREMPKCQYCNCDCECGRVRIEMKD